MKGERFSKKKNDKKNKIKTIASRRAPFHHNERRMPAPGTVCVPGAPCVLNSTTVTMPIYDAKDSLDTGEFPICAIEFYGQLFRA